MIVGILALGVCAGMVAGLVAFSAGYSFLMAVGIFFLTEILAVLAIAFATVYLCPSNREQKTTAYPVTSK